MYVIMFFFVCLIIDLNKNADFEQPYGNPKRPYNYTGI